MVARPPFSVAALDHNDGAVHHRRSTPRRRRQEHGRLEDRRLHRARRARRVQRVVTPTADAARFHLPASLPCVPPAKGKGLGMRASGKGLGVPWSL